MNSNFLSVAIEAAPKNRHGLMLFGSCARGDSGEFSDVDILVLKDGKPELLTNGRTNFSCYSAAALSKLSLEGSLFVKHLIKDGVIIEDPHKLIEKSLRHYMPPVDYSSLQRNIVMVLPILDVNARYLERYENGLMDVAIYCLRTIIYLRADQQGVLTFSLKELYAKTGWSEVQLLIRLKNRDSLRSRSDYVEVVSTLEKELNAVAVNSLGSIESYITFICHDAPLVVSLGLRVLSGQSVDMNYDSLCAFPIIS